MIAQHDYTQRLYDLMIMRNRQRYRWQGSLASAKWYLLHARNTGDTAHQNVCATRARQRYEGAARLAKLDGVPSSEFLAYWKSL